jgi:hypothetical protein
MTPLIGAVIFIIEQGLIEVGLGHLNCRFAGSNFLQRRVSAGSIGIDRRPCHLRDTQALLVVLSSGGALGRKDCQPRHIIFSLCSGRFVLSDFAKRRLVVRLRRFHLRFGLSEPGASTLDCDHVVAGTISAKSCPLGTA